VYEAENTWTTRRVAIKVLLPMFSSDPTSVARFQGEAQAATRLAHPNIVDVLDMGQDSTTGALYIVQEFLRGRDLREHLDEHKRFAPSEAAEILVPVMGALALAHEHNIIHRDLKPENIFLVTSGPVVVPKLIDFGLSKVLGEDGTKRKTITGTIMGTPYYMSPEQARGDRTVDARSDIWAMGAVLFEMVTGTLPFEADSATLILMKVLTAPAPRVETIAPDVPTEVAAIIHRAMEPDLSKRYPTLREMLDDVLACRSFQNPDQRTTLRERFVRSIEHKPPIDSAAPDGNAATMLASPSTPNAASARALKTPAAAEIASLDSWQTRRAASVAVRPRRTALIVATLALLVGIGAAAIVITRTPSAPTTPTRAAVQAAPSHGVSPPSAPAVTVLAQPAAAADTDAGAVARPTVPARPPGADPALAERPSRSSRHRSHRRRENDPLAPVAPP
jgi:serine/threonine-protein kinase